MPTTSITTQPLTAIAITTTPLTAPAITTAAAAAPQRKKFNLGSKVYQVNQAISSLLSNLDVNREITFELFFLVWSLRQQKESFLHFRLPSVFTPMFKLILNSDMDEIRRTLGPRRPTPTPKKALMLTQTLTPTIASVTTKRLAAASEEF